MDDVEPQLAILYDEVALSSLKRPQLVALCRTHSIKANGKNVDLVDKLLQHGKELQAHESTVHNDSGQMSGAWTWIDTVPHSSHVRESTNADQDPVSDQNGFVLSPVSTTVEQESSSSFSSQDTVMQDRFVPLNDVASVHSCMPAVGSKGEDSPPSKQFAVTATDSSTRSNLYPSLSPDSIKTFSAKSHEARILQSPSQTSIKTLTTELANTTTSTTAPGIRLVGIVADSPTKSSVSGSTVQVPKMMPGTFVFGSTDDAATTSTTFTFSARVTGADKTEFFKTNNQAAQAVLQEMNQRAIHLKGSSTSKTNQFNWFASGSKRGLTDQHDKDGKKSEFDGKHKRAFDRMDSIVHHYAAKRTASTALGSSSTSSALHRSTSSQVFSKLGSTSADTNIHDPADRAKRIKLSSSTNSKESGMSRSSTMSKLATVTTKDKKIVSSLVSSGWTTASSSRPTSRGDYLSATSGELGQFIPSQKRQLKMLKARRKSQIGQIGPAGRRKSFGLKGAQPRPLRIASPVEDVPRPVQHAHLVAVSTPPRPLSALRTSRSYVSTRATMLSLGPSRIAIHSPMTVLKSGSRSTTTSTGPAALGTSSTTDHQGSGVTSSPALSRSIGATNALLSGTTKPRPFSFASASRSRTLPKSSSAAAFLSVDESQSTANENGPVDDFGSSIVKSKSCATGLKQQHVRKVQSVEVDGVGMTSLNNENRPVISKADTQDRRFAFKARAKLGSSSLSVKRASATSGGKTRSTVNLNVSNAKRTLFGSRQG
ncbi:hypothetical protein OIO90_005303 [Microbotryomycetes sp. JL221]|nr:hypothetical protein OIO90_005303 [Microbotryomycetes sp. JL221]